MSDRDSRGDLEDLPHVGLAGEPGGHGAQLEGESIRVEGRAECDAIGDEQPVPAVVLSDQTVQAVAGGQADLEGKMFRISHMGYVDPLDTLGLAAAIAYTLTALGVKTDAPAAVAACAKVMESWA